jgi:hypothetical protein
MAGSAPGSKGRMLKARQKFIWTNKTTRAITPTKKVGPAKSKTHKPSGIIDLGHEPSEARIKAANESLRNRAQLGLAGRATKAPAPPKGLGPTKTPKAGGGTGPAKTPIKIRPARPAESAGSTSRGGEGSSSTTALNAQAKSSSPGFAKGAAAGVAATAIANKIAQARQKSPKVKSGTTVHPGTTPSSASQKLLTAGPKLLKSGERRPPTKPPQAPKTPTIRIKDTTSKQEGGAKAAGATTAKVKITSTGTQSTPQAPTPSAPKIKVTPAPAQGVSQSSKGKSATVQPASVTKVSTPELKTQVEARVEKIKLKAAATRGKPPKVNISQPDVSSVARSTESPSKAGIDKTVAGKPAIRILKPAEAPAAAAATSQNKPVATASAPKATPAPKTATANLESQVAAARAEQIKLKAAARAEQGAGKLIIPPQQSMAGRQTAAILRKKSREASTPLPVKVTPSTKAPSSVNMTGIGAEQKAKTKRVGPAERARDADEKIAKIKAARAKAAVAERTSVATKAVKAKVVPSGPGQLGPAGPDIVEQVASKRGGPAQGIIRTEAKVYDPKRQALIEAHMKRKGFTKGPDVAALRKAHEDWMAGKLSNEDYTKRLKGQRVGVKAAKKLLSVARKVR